MKQSRGIITTIAVFTIVWDLAFETYPAIIGYINNAAAPTTFGLQTCAEIITSLALLYLLYGRYPTSTDEREIITSTISALTFIALAVASFVYLIAHGDVRVIHNTTFLHGVTFNELALSIAGVTENIIGWRLHKSMMKLKYSATQHAHSHQLILCMTASLMVGFAALAPQFGWPRHWLSPETVGAFIICAIAMYEGLHIWEQRKHHQHASPHQT